MEINIDRSQWKNVRLGDVAYEYSERINDPSSSIHDKFVGSSNIGRWDFRITSFESTNSVTSAMKLFRENDYLLVRRSLYASDFRERAPRAQFSGVCSGDILTIRENPERVADGFLIGILNSPGLWRYVVANASGSITRRIKWKDLANYEFLLPPKDQQAELAELLWATNHLIENMNSSMNSALSLKQAQLKAVFKKEACDKYRISDIAINLDNKRKPIAKSLRIKGSTPYYGASGIVDYVEGYTHNEPILLIAEDGENLNSRNLPIAYSVDGECWVNNHTHVLQMKSLSRYLVREYFNSSDISNYITGGTRPKLTKGSLMSMFIYLPKREFLTIKEKELRTIDKTIGNLRNAVNESKNLLSALINQIF